MAEPAPKKAKLDTKDSILQEFKHDKAAIRELDKTVGAMLNGYDLFKFGFLKIESASADVAESFSNASVRMSFYSKDGVPEFHNTYSIFQAGIITLKKYIEEDEIPVNKPARKALIKLFSFLNECHDSLTPKTEVTECAWTVQLAQHLFSPLAVGSHFKIDHHYSKIGSVCPCPKKDKIVGDFADTSFGVARAWHGNVDIYLENITINVAKRSDDQQRERLPSASDSDEGNDSVVEVKTTGDFNTGAQKSQMLAQTIVFSFLQRKLNNCSDKKLRNMLIPSIGVNTKKVIVHFYDCDNDVLLQSAPRCLFSHGKLKIDTIVFLWMVLNYRCFCTGITDSMKQYKACVFDKAKEYIPIYQDEVEVPCKTIPDRDDEEDFWGLSTIDTQTELKDVYFSFEHI